MSDFDSVVSRYLAVWNETDPPARRKRIDELFAADVRYVDPMAAVSGREALDGLVGAVQQQFPGLTFSLGEPVDAHHDQARFGWTVNGPDGGVAVAGIDVVTFGADGRIQTAIGFFGDIAAA